MDLKKRKSNIKNPKTNYIRLRIDKKCLQQLEELCGYGDDGNGKKMKMSAMIRSLIGDKHTEVFNNINYGYKFK